HVRISQSGAYAKSDRIWFDARVALGHAAAHCPGRSKLGKITDLAPNKKFTMRITCSENQKIPIISSRARSELIASGKTHDGYNYFINEYPATKNYSQWE